MRPKKRYAVEAKFIGEGVAPWKGWKVIRTYISAKSRDTDLRRLDSLHTGIWQYRIKSKEVSDG